MSKHSKSSFNNDDICKCNECIQKTTDILYSLIPPSMKFNNLNNDELNKKIINCEQKILSYDNKISDIFSTTIVFDEKINNIEKKIKQQIIDLIKKNNTKINDVLSTIKHLEDTLDNIDNKIKQQISDLIKKNNTKWSDYDIKIKNISTSTTILEEKIINLTKNNNKFSDFDTRLTILYNILDDIKKKIELSNTDELFIKIENISKNLETNNEFIQKIIERLNKGEEVLRAIVNQIS